MTTRLIERIAEETGFSKEYIEENSESSAHRSRFASAFSDRDWQGMSTQDRLWQSQRLVILGLAEKDRASSSAAAPIISCGTEPTV